MPHETPPARTDGGGRPLRERKLWIPQMSWGGAVAFAAAFRSVSIDAEICPDSDARTLELGSCHTSLVGGYVIEGHVPADLVKRLLAERPKIAGLAVPGMPASAPGMDIPGQPYTIVGFDKAGQLTVYERR